MTRYRHVPDRRQQTSVLHNAPDHADDPGDDHLEGKEREERPGGGGEPPSGEPVEDRRPAVTADRSDRARGDLVWACDLERDHDRGEALEDVHRGGRHRAAACTLLEQHVRVQLTDVAPHAVKRALVPRELRRRSTPTAAAARRSR